jgi:pyruvate dehydrogenase E2 component (dihydrolipoamide acetyltransferase)
MRVKVKMPKLGLTMTEATVLEWRRTVGEQVQAGEPLLVIETEKAEVELEAPATGTLVEILGQLKAVYAIGEVLAVIDVPGESAGA